MTARTAGGTPLGRRIAVLTGSVVAIAVLAAGLVTDRVIRDEQYGAIDDFLVDWADRATRSPLGRPPVPGENERVPVDFADVVVLRIDAPDGDVLFTSEAFAIPDRPADVAAGELRTVEADGRRFRVIVAEVESGATVQIGRDLGEADDTVAAIRVRLLLIGALVTIAAGVLGWLLARRLARPIERLADAADQVSRTGRLRTSDDRPSSDSAGDRRGAPAEVRRLASSFDEMLAALERSQERQHRLVGDAGHELRTPLTTIRTDAEMLRSGRLSAADTRVAADRIVAEVRELGDLADELIELARGSDAAEPATVTDVRALVDAVADRAATRTGSEVVVTGPAVVATVQPRRFDRAVSNLVDNALKFSEPGAPVEITVAAGHVEVRDRGIGIDQDDAPRVFERFYRAEAARSERGSGLGLAIVAQVATDHHGEPYVRAPSDGIGAIVGFTFASDDDLVLL